MTPVSREKLLPLLAEAARRHGHACPSLLYGVRLVAMLLDRLPPGAGIEAIAVRHSSPCLKDGAEAVLAARPSLPPASSCTEGGDCSVEASWARGAIRVSVRPEVREKVNLLKAGHDLQSFREAGVEWLLGLSEEEFAEITAGRER